MRALVRVTAWERVSPWRRGLGALIRVGILIAFLSLLFSLLGPPLSIYILARWEARKVPALNLAPRTLVDYSVSNSPGRTLSYFGYEFDVPWNTAYKEKGGEGGLVQLQFESGQNVTFIVPQNQSGLLAEIADDPSLKRGNLRLVFGDLLSRSAYDQYAALLSTTPRTIPAFGPRAEAARGAILLTIKGIAFGPRLESGTFSFELPDKRGFQIGDPQKSKRVDLEVFDFTGHHIEVLCGSASGNVRFSQAELNRILTSLHSTTSASQLTQVEK